MFLHCLLLDLTVIDLMTIEIWVEIAKNLEMRTSGGGGGSQSFRTPPDEGGRGGVKKGQIFADVLYGWPQGGILGGLVGFLGS